MQKKIAKKQTELQKFILHITPQTHIRTTHDDRKCFRIPETVLIEKYPSLLKRKKLIERYNDYKFRLWEEAQRQNFALSNAGMSIAFRMPVPPSWREGKKRKAHMQPCYSAPDIDNLLKAMFDTLRPSGKRLAKLRLENKAGEFIYDASIWHLSGLEKTWVDFPLGWIEIKVTPSLHLDPQIQSDQLTIFDIK